MIHVRFARMQAVFIWPHGWQSNDAELLHVLQKIQLHADRPLYVPNEEYQAYVAAKELLPGLELVDGPKAAQEIDGRVW